LLAVCRQLRPDTDSDTDVDTDVNTDEDSDIDTDTGPDAGAPKLIVRTVNQAGGEIVAPYAVLNSEDEVVQEAEGANEFILPLGEYTVKFGELEGYLPPNPVEVPVNLVDEDVEINGMYMPS
jgi:hypothetical protein